MSLGFRKSVNIIPGEKLNLSRSDLEFLIWLKEASSKRIIEK